MDQETKEAIEKLSGKIDNLEMILGKICKPLVGIKECLKKRWVRVTTTLLFGLGVVLVMAFAWHEIHGFVSNPAVKNAATTTSVTTNGLICCSNVTNYLASAVCGTNTIPVSVTITTTTMTAAITDGQWYALILLLVPLILAAIVVIVVFCHNDDD